jgi:hypothetical protein
MSFSTRQETPLATWPKMLWGTLRQMLEPMFFRTLAPTLLPMPRPMLLETSRWTLEGAVFPPQTRERRMLEY